VIRVASIKGGTLNADLHDRSITSNTTDAVEIVTIKPTISTAAACSRRTRSSRVAQVFWPVNAF
jgi:hypothetical protein